ncbi:stage III sporulation protein AF [Virgibacillus doumboii]|uniref:stage III sporulation protein AF n=1 Tax=Virgibacillus doumboii TaxID=2697503 RepID=UPI0013DFA4D8|nr:stage III sporulation protein AF [Virgibacillus doumboii]
MEFVIQWVTQIIIFLLLASVVDLLIPATAMKKYVKLVVGLILILIFLKPVFTLFDTDVQQALETSFSQINNQNSESEQVGNLIKKQKSEIQDSQNAYILEQTVVQLKDLAKTPLKENFQAEISDIKFLFSSESEPSFKNLKEIIVFLQESETGVGSIDTVEDVVVNTDKPFQDESEIDKEGIKQLLQDIWEINNKKLTVKWEGGSL